MSKFSKALKALENIYEEELMELAQDSVVPSICISCLAEGDGVEPDAEKYTCYSCEERAVYSATMLYMYSI